MRATAKDLRFHSKELLEAVDRGEEVTITFRGKPCAKLVPYTESTGKEGPKSLFGIWQDNPAVADVADYVDELRKGRF